MKVPRLRDIRERRLLTQPELAAVAGLGLSTIVRMEAGRPCRISNIRKVATALGLRADELLGEDKSA